MEQNEDQQYPEENKEQILVVDHEGVQLNQQRDDLEEQALIEKDRPPRQESLYRKALHEDLPLFRSLTSDPDWDFIIEPKNAEEDDIEKPTIEMQEDYYPDIEKYNYPMTSRIVMFTFAIIFLGITLTLISVLCFEWGESTVFWSTIGGLIFTWGYLLVLRSDKKKRNAKKQAYIDERNKVKAQDQEAYDKEMEIYNEKLKKRHHYVMVINQIKRMSKKLFCDKNPRVAVKLYHDSVLNPYLKIRNSIPEFCQKFIEEEIKDVGKFYELEEEYKPLYIKDIFSTHLFLNWMLAHTFATQELRPEEASEFNDLKKWIEKTLQYEDICQYIAELVEEEDDPYTAEKVKEIFSELDLDGMSNKEKYQAIFNKVKKVQILYKKINKALTGEDEPQVREYDDQPMDFGGLEKITDRAQDERKTSKRNLSPTRALMKRLTMKPGDKQKQYQVSEGDSKDYAQEEAKDDPIDF